MLEIIHINHESGNLCTCAAGREGYKMMRAESTGDLGKVHATLLEVLAAVMFFTCEGEGFDESMTFHFPDGSAIVVSYDGEIH